MWTGVQVLLGQMLDATGFVPGLISKAL